MPENTQSTPPAQSPAIVAAMAGANAPAPQADEFTKIIPEAYKEKPYLKNVKSVEDLFKQFDNAQGLIGAPKLPKADAPKEDWDKFYKTIGRPDKADDYGLFSDKDPDNIKTVNKEMQQTLFDAGLTKPQAEKIAGKFKEVVGKQTSLTQESDAKFAEDFTKATEKIFGTEKDAAVTTAQKLVDTFAPAEVKAQLGKMDPATMAAVAAVLKGISDKYISSDDIAQIRSGTPAGGSRTKETLTAELMKVMGSDEYKDFMKGPVHRAAVERADSLAKQIAAIKAA